jgi:hypothetical protein
MSARKRVRQEKHLWVNIKNNSLAGRYVVSYVEPLRESAVAHKANGWSIGSRGPLN